MTLCVDVMFVNKVTLLITVSRTIHYRTVHGFTSMKIPVLETAIKNIVKSYAVQGFMMKFILANLQFNVILDHNNIDRVSINLFLDMNMCKILNLISVL